MKTKHHVTRHKDEPETSNEFLEGAENQAAPEESGRKPATEPWKAETAEDSPRKRGILGLSKGKTGHELRWVRLDSVERRKNQGYELATPEDFDAKPDENGMIRRNELVLMTVPKDVYAARRKEVNAMTAAQTAAPRREYLRERQEASRRTGTNLSDEGRDEE